MIELGSGDYSSHVNGQGHPFHPNKIDLISQDQQTIFQKSPLVICSLIRNSAVWPFYCCISRRCNIILNLNKFNICCAFRPRRFHLYHIGVFLIFIIQFICNGNETFSLMGSRFILRGQDWSQKVKPLYQQLPLQITISWISQRRPIKSNLLVNWINWVNVI